MYGKYLIMKSIIFGLGAAIEEVSYLHFMTIQGDHPKIKLETWKPVTVTTMTKRLRNTNGMADKTEARETRTHSTPHPFRPFVTSLTCLNRNEHILCRCVSINRATKRKPIPE